MHEALSHTQKNTLESNSVKVLIALGNNQIPSWQVQNLDNPVFVQLNRRPIFPTPPSIPQSPVTGTGPDRFTLPSLGALAGSGSTVYGSRKYWDCFTL